MTDDTGASANAEAKEPSAADEIQEAVKNVSNQLTGGERLIAAAVLVILVVNWLWASLILDDYSLSKAELLIPFGLLAAMYFYYSGKDAPWHPLYGTIVKVGAWAIVIMAFYDFVDDTLIESVRYSGARLFYELVFYAAGVLAAVGAWQLRTDTR